MGNKLFYCALLFSSVFHLGVVRGFSLTSVTSIKESAKRMEVTYQALKPQNSKMLSNEKSKFRGLKLAKKMIKTTKKIRILSKKAEHFQPSMRKNIRDITKIRGKFKLDKKQSPHIKTLDVERKIMLPRLKSEKITNPQYLTYDKDMRHEISQNIKNHAAIDVDHPDFQEGNVYLTFVLVSNGILTRIKIVEEKTEANNYLRKIALRSVKESSPFSSFPQGFDYPEFTFNLLISFRE